MEIKLIVKKQQRYHLKMLAPGIALTMMMTITVIAIPGHITFAQKPRQIYLSEETPKELIDTVWQIVNRQYIDGTFNGQDWQAVRKEYLSRSYNSKQEAYTAIRQMLEKLGDPFTRFIDPQEFKETYSNEDNVGIGLQININQKLRN